MSKEKKPFSLKKEIIFCVVSIVVAVALIVGNYIALGMYKSIITVFFSGGDYVQSEEESELCEEVEGEGIVLLKNEDNALPLKDTEKKLALLGQDSVDFVYGGSGSGSVDTATAPTLKDALEDAGYTVDETLWNFYDTGAGKSYRKTVPDESGNGSFAVNEVPGSVLDTVASCMDSDDVGIVVIGRSGGESADLPIDELSTGYSYLEPDANELYMMKLACQKFDKVILLVNSSNAMELGILDDPDYANIKAALWVGGVGQEGMYAIGDVLNGTTNPSGRLADTYAYDSTSSPAVMNQGDFTITNSSVTNGTNYIAYEEGIYVGYRYYETRYEDSVLGKDNVGTYDYASTVQFPFGYGLSYTTFSWTDYSAELSEDGKTVNVSITVTNTGDYAGKDVVELYVQAPYYTTSGHSSIEKSSVVLVGYAKTDLLDAKGGENCSQTLTIPVDLYAFASYDYADAGKYVLEAGDYYLAAGRNAHDALNNILLANASTSQQENIEQAGDASAYTADKDLVATALSLTEEDSTTYSTSVTGYKVENQFEAADVNYYETTDGVTYVSRANWQGTLPTAAFKNGSWSATQKMLDDLEFYAGDEVVNDSNAVMPANGSTKTSYTVQDLAGQPYDSTMWDDIVNQLTVAQMTRLVRLGGYSTIQIDSIGLPATIDKDGPSGFSNTLVGGVATMAWPTEVVFASTWNDPLIEEVGEMIGQESIDAGIAGWYAPGANIHRSPYSGRNFEYFSEDGLLSGKIGAAEMRGVRSKGVIAYMKHFALNDQETNRYGVSVFANEQSIREIYLKGFEYITTEGGCNAAMASMNRVGTRWSGACKGLMTEVLRNEWGFEGMVITDQASVSAMFYQDMISGLWAGTDIWLNTNNSYWSLADYTDNATVMTNVHNAARNIIYTIANSNAVVDFSSEGGGTKDIDTSMPTWEILLIVADVIIFAACACGIVIPTVFYVRDNVLRKKKSDGGN